MGIDVKTLYCSTTGHLCLWQRGMSDLIFIGKKVSTALMPLLLNVILQEENFVQAARIEHFGREDGTIANVERHPDGEREQIVVLLDKG